MDGSINSIASHKLLFLGIGRFTSNLIRKMSNDYECVIICDSKTMDSFKNYDKNRVHFLIGDTNSIVVWKKLPLKEISHVLISAFDLVDHDVIEDLCHIVREVFKMQIPVIGFYENTIPAYFEKYNVTPIDPVATSVSVASKIINNNYTIPASIGLAKGEIIEVSILRRSHLTNRTLSAIESERWHVAAIYRSGNLIITKEDTELLVGDRVILIGEPKVILNIAKLLMHGTPSFPLQYGENILVHVNEEGSVIDESKFIQQKTNAKGIIINNKNEIHYKKLNLLDNYGIIIIDTPQRFTWFNRRIRYFVRNTKNPLLLSKGSFPYSTIIVSMNCSQPDFALQVASELSVQMQIPLKIIYAVMPEDLQNAAIKEEIRYRENIVHEYEHIERIKFDFHKLEGNPVVEILNFMKSTENALFIIGNNPNDSISLLEPHIPHLIAEKIECSVLLIPEIK